MGNRSTSSSLRNAIIHLSISADQIGIKDEKFWAQILGECPEAGAAVLKSIGTQNIRMLRDGAPRNFALLAYKMVECLSASTATLCNTHNQQAAVLNATRVLTKIIPCVFEDPRWHDFFQLNSLGQEALVYPQKNADERDYASYLPNAHNLIKSKPSADDDKRTNEERDDEAEDKGCCENRKRAAEVAIANLLLDEESLICNIDDKLHLNGLPNCDKPRSNGNASNIADEATKTKPSHESPTTTTTTDTLMDTMITCICDLLFCPEFTVLSHGDNYLSNVVDAPPEDLKSLSTYDYVWEPGVGFDSCINSTTSFDKNRSELLRALLVCLSNVLYLKPEQCIERPNHWMERLVGKCNRHVLPLFTSLLNVVLVYRPARALLHLGAASASRSSGPEDSRESLVELSLHLLLAALDYSWPPAETDANETSGESRCGRWSSTENSNLFIEYMSRIHRDEDYTFMQRGFTKLLNDHLASVQRYLWAPARQMDLDLELMLLFWKTCNLNRKFMLHLLKSNETLDLIVPILYHLNENFQDPSRTALIHLAVFNLLILSGERNFGVKLNRPYANGAPMSNLPDFSGSHADLMIIIFHKLIMYGYKINQLYDYLLNILANISPYLKSLTILACKCLIQLFETFSSAFVVFTEPNYHQLVVFLLEIFNNIIQYQSDSNANLIYVLLSKRELFSKLANLPTSQSSIDSVLRKLTRRKMRLRKMEKMTLEQQLATNNCDLSEHSSSACNKHEPRLTAQEAQVFDFDLATVSCDLCQHDSSPDRLEVSLVATPDIHKFTHPTHPFLASSNSAAIPAERADNNEMQATKQAPTISLDELLGRPTPAITGTEKTLTRASSMDSSASDDNSRSTDNLQSRTGPTVDSNNKKWHPTGEWLIEWKRSLPLQTILRMIAVLVPQLEHIKQHNLSLLSSSSSTALARADENEIISFLQNGTLVGLLPVPHPILIRKYRTNNRDSVTWFRACTWAIIYVKSAAWRNTSVRLIRIL